MEPGTLTLMVWCKRVSQEGSVAQQIAAKGVGTNSRVCMGAKPSASMLLHQYISRAHLCGLHNTQKFDKVHYYLYLTTDSPSHKYKHCCLCSLFRGVYRIYKRGFPSVGCIHTLKVWMCIMHKQGLHALSRGVWGHAPPRKFLKIKCPESRFGGISATKCNLYTQPLKIS